jgi:hypothetical protein
LPYGLDEKLFAVQDWMDKSGYSKMLPIPAEKLPGING